MRVVYVIVGLLAIGFAGVAGIGLSTAIERKSRPATKFFGVFTALGLAGAWWAFMRASVPTTRGTTAGIGGGFLGTLLDGRVHTEEELIALAERHGKGLERVEHLLPTLSPDNARRLLAHADGRPIDLDGVKTLSTETAAVLGGHLGRLELNGLVELSPECARHLAGIPAPLLLNGVRVLSPEAAAGLARHHGVLCLDGLKSLPPDVASHLARHRHISHLGRFYNRLSLNGVETLSEESAAALSAYLGNLSLNGLRNLAPDAARRLVKHRTDEMWSVAELYSLLLDGLTSLSDDVAFALADYHGGLSLDGLVKPSHAVLRGLAGHRGPALSLGRLRWMPDDVAVLFGERPKWLHLPSLRDVSPAALAALRRNPHVTLPDGVTGSG